MLYFDYMYVSLNDLLLIVSILAITGIALYLCVTLHEIAKLLRNINSVTTVVKKNVERVDHFVEGTIEKVSGLSKYSGVLTKVGEFIAEHAAEAVATSSKKKTKKGMPSLSDLDE